MTTYGVSDRLEESRKARNRQIHNYQLIVGGIVVIMFLVAGISIFTNRYELVFSDWLGIASQIVNDLKGYFENIYTEIISVVATVLILNRIYDKRDTERRKRQLFREARRSLKDVAVNALDELKHEGEDWLGEFLALKQFVKVDWSTSSALPSNVDLQGANFSGATLIDTYLHKANLERAQFWNATLDRALLAGANLQSAQFGSAYLTRTNLFMADLTGAYLWDVRLQNANLMNAIFHNATIQKCYLQNAILESTQLQNATLTRSDLRGANLRKARLQGTNLKDASLEGANAYDIRLSQETILPDGKPCEQAELWSQLERFTDRNHPNFWEPEWVKKEREATEE